MTPYLDDVARATLPVAIVLVILAGAARAVLWARLDGERAQLARRYAEPLALAGLAAITVHALALALSATADAVSLILLLVVAVPAALLMRAPGEPRDERPLPRRETPAPAQAAPAARPSAPVKRAPAAQPSRPSAPAGSLWLHQRDDEDERREGSLWAR